MSELDDLLVCLQSEDTSHGTAAASNRNDQEASKPDDKVHLNLSSHKT